MSTLRREGSVQLVQLGFLRGRTQRAQVRLLELVVHPINLTFLSGTLLISTSRRLSKKKCCFSMQAERGITTETKFSGKLILRRKSLSARSFTAAKEFTRSALSLQGPTNWPKMSLNLSMHSTLQEPMFRHPRDLSPTKAIKLEIQS